MESEPGTARQIVYYGDPVLHRPCSEVTRFDAELEQLVADMFASMAAAEGVGLAANQIGISLRVFVVDCPDATGERVVGHIVNPVLHISQADRELEVSDEGCLSVPGPYAEVGRPAVASVTGFTMHEEPITINGTGLLARCLQHEVDHLEGFLYVDRLSKRARKKILAAAGLAQ